MKILLISNQIPYPPHTDGGTNAVYHLVEGLYEQNHQIDYLYTGALDGSVPEEFQKLLHHFDVLSCLHTRSLFRSGLNLLARRPEAMSAAPMRPVYYRTRTEYDLIIYDQIKSTFVRTGQTENNVLFAIDSFSRLYRQQFEFVRGIRKLYKFVQLKLMMRFEQELYPRFSKVVFVSSCDAQYASASFKMHHMEYANLGVSSISENPAKPLRLTFTGNFAYQPNEDAALYFCRDILPKLKEEGKNVRFMIAGKNPTPEILGHINDPAVEITGFVSSMEEIFEQTDIFVSPLRIGTGMKNKVLEAMLAGLPMVLSSISAEGIDGLVSGETCLIADTPQEWIGAIRALADRPELRAELAAKAKQVVTENYRWSDYSRQFIKKVVAS